MLIICIISIALHIVAISISIIWHSSIPWITMLLSDVLLVVVVLIKTLALKKPDDEDNYEDVASQSHEQMEDGVDHPEYEDVQFPNWGNSSCLPCFWKTIRDGPVIRPLALDPLNDQSSDESSSDAEEDDDTSSAVECAVVRPEATSVAVKMQGCHREIARQLLFVQENETAIPYVTMVRDKTAVGDRRKVRSDPGFVHGRHQQRAKDLYGENHIENIPDYLVLFDDNNISPRLQETLDKAEMEEDQRVMAKLLSDHVEEGGIQDLTVTLDGSFRFIRLKRTFIKSLPHQSQREIAKLLTAEAAVIPCLTVMLNGDVRTVRIKGGNGKIRQKYETISRPWMKNDNYYEKLVFKIRHHSADTERRNKVRDGKKSSTEITEDPQRRSLFAMQYKTEETNVNMGATFNGKSTNGRCNTDDEYDAVVSACYEVLHDVDKTGIPDENHERSEEYHERESDDANKSTSIDDYVDWRMLSEEGRFVIKRAQSQESFSAMTENLTSIDLIAKCNHADEIMETTFSGKLGQEQCNTERNNTKEEFDDLIGTCSKDFDEGNKAGIMTDFRQMEQENPKRSCLDEKLNTTTDDYVDWQFLTQVINKKGCSQESTNDDYVDWQTLVMENKIVVQTNCKEHPNFDSETMNTNNE